MDERHGRDHVNSTGLRRVAARTGSAGHQGTDFRSEAGRDHRAIRAFDQADDAARELAATFARIRECDGEIGEAFDGAVGAAQRLAAAFGAVADVLRDEAAAGKAARRGSLSRDYVADLLGAAPSPGAWRQLTLAEFGPDQADAHPEQHTPGCPALAGFDCDRGCPDGERWNAERARRIAILAEPDEQPTG